MEAVSDELYQRVLALFLAVGFGLLASRIAWRKGFYNLPPFISPERELPLWKYVVQSFAIFLFIEMFLGPLLYGAWVYIDQGSFSELTELKVPKSIRGWANLGIIGLTFVSLLAYYASLPKPAREVIWGSPAETRSIGQNIHDFLTGAVTWIIAYPWVIVIGQLLGILLDLIYTGTHTDQAAVKHLKDIFDDPGLFIATVIAVVSIIPFIEELLFRGFLQSWLLTAIGRRKAILLTSLIFALFHFSISQGIENIEFISSLFLLSCYLGFVKERQRSLWASIGLHATFNFISILMLLAEFSK